jgi:hypothetical protein
MPLPYPAPFRLRPPPVGLAVGGQRRPVQDRDDAEHEQLLNEPLPLGLGGGAQESQFAAKQ